MGILDLTALELGRKIKAKEITSVEAVQAVLEQIRKTEPAVHAYVSYDEESALKRAEEVQKQIDDGTLTGPLAGVPMAVKDNICTKGYNYVQFQNSRKFCSDLCRSGGGKPDRCRCGHHRKDEYG
jgi:aspartyl-tRNA(Asn)/glutamyl-tRNA(Gln) amidotransferase subunit A